MKKSSSFKILLSTTILLLVFIFAGMANSLHGFQSDIAQETTVTTRYVTTNGNCGGVTPCYDNIQSAVDAANSGDEIRVAGGTYTGVSNVAVLNSDKRTASRLNSSV